MILTVFNVLATWKEYEAMKRTISVLLVVLCAFAFIGNAVAEGWVCESCGTSNTGNFCSNCGAQKPSATWICPSCGQENDGNFCPNCGTQKPSANGAPPAARAGSISNLKCKGEDGITTITWEDSSGNGPYTLYFTASEWVDYGTTYGLEGLTQRSTSCSFLIPGVTYSITVTDGTSSDTVNYTVPKSTFTEFKDAKALTISPDSFDLSGDKYYTTFRLEINYPTLARDRNYAWVLALRSPLGYASMVYYEDQFKMERRYTGYYWDLAMNEFMDAVKANFGTIPRGEYTFECYFNGCIYGSKTFMVYP